MLNRGDDDGPVFGEGKFEAVYGEGGAAVGVKVKETSPTPCVIADPSYFPDLCEKKGIIGAIAIVNAHRGHREVGGSVAWVIFPGRRSAARTTSTSSTARLAQGRPRGKYIVFISTNVEARRAGMSTAALAERELAGGLAVLRGVVRIFYDQYDEMVPKADGLKDKIFLTRPSTRPTSRPPSRTCSGSISASPARRSS